MTMAHVFRDGGPMMVAILAWALVAWLPPVVAAVLTALRFRVPAAVWVLGPVVLLILGAVGTWHGMSLAAEAIQHASVEIRATLAAAGIAAATVTEAFARGLASVAFLFVAWLAAITHLIGAGKSARWTPTHAIAPAAIAVVLAIGAVGAAVGWRLGSIGLSIPAMALLGGLPIAVVALRSVDVWAERDEDATEAVRADARRLAGGRALVTLCAVAAVWTAGTAVQHAGIIQTLSAAAHAAPEMRLELIARGTEVANAGWTLGMISATGLGLAGLVATGPLLPHLAHWRTGVGAALLALLLVPLGTLWIVQGATATALTTVMAPVVVDR